MSHDIFYSKYWYDPERNGALDEYLRAQFEDNGTFRQFKGLRQFHMLWRQGFFTPGFSVIRLMYNTFRFDEHYVVIDADTLEGIAGGAHTGKPGSHKVSDILNRKAPTFEAHNLQEDPEKRKEAVNARALRDRCS